MPLVHLSSKQRKCRPLTSGIVWPENIERAEIPEVVERLVGGDKSAREELSNGLCYLIPYVVGRYLFHWPMTRRFEDDMVGEASLALMEAIDSITEVEQAQWLASMAIARMCRAIESFINDHQEIVSAPLRVNERLAQQGKDPEYPKTVQLDENSLVSRDTSQEEVDLKDLFETLASCDGEELVTLVLKVLEEKHGMTLEDMQPWHHKVIRELSQFIRELA